MARLTLQLLGPPELTLDEQPLVGLASDKVRALLFHLAVERDRPHRRETLAGLLWPDYPERSARTNLSNALSNLRTALGDREADNPCLHVSREAIQFNDASDHWVDANAFTAFAALGEWEQAAALYRGPFLEGFSLSDSPAFEQWALVTRERLQREAIDALGQLTAQYEERGDLAQAIATTRRQLAIEPCHEEGQRALMRLLALDGQRSAALAQYEACVRALEEELDAAPSPETTALYDRIREGEDLSGLANLTGLGALPPHNLPAQLTPFVGREALLCQIDERLQDPACRLLTLIGPGGAGKTRLALEAAHRQLEAYRDGVYVAFLGALQSVEAIAPTIAQALDLPLQRGDPYQQLLNYLRGREMLLVLDNWEHLLAGAALVTEMLQAAAGLQIVATSRARLNVQGEHLLPLGGMDLPPASLGDPERAVQYSAVQLFLQGARRAEPGFALGDDNVADVIRICHLVEGIPLALLLAAAWVRALSSAEIATEVETDIDVLASEGRDVPERQRSMRAVFDHSWRLLDAHQQQVLAALSSFRGGCTREAAQRIAGASSRDLMALVDRSLLAHTPAGRYEMHELLRQYAEERLATSSAYAAVQDRHAAYYARALEQGYERYERHQRQIDLSQIASDIDNVRAAWDWAVARRRVTDLVRAVLGLSMFYELYVRYREGETACRRAAEALKEDASIEGLRVRGVALMRQAAFLLSLGEASRARACCQQSLALLDHLASMGEDTRREKAQVLDRCVYEAMNRDLLEAEHLGKMALDLCDQVDDRLGQWKALFTLGWVAKIAERHVQAKKYFEAAVALAKEMGHQWDLAVTLVSLGWPELAQGRLNRAEQYARENIAFFEQSETPHRASLARTLLGSVHIARGEYIAAGELLAEALAHYQEVSDQLNVRDTTLSLGLADLHLGHYQQAEKRARTAQAMAQEAGERSGYAEGLLLEGQVLLGQRRYDDAAQGLQKSLDAHQEWGRAPSKVRTTLCHVLLASGDLEQAEQHLRKAIRTVATSEDFLGKLDLLPIVALLLAVRGDAERASELYALAMRYPYVANSRWFEQVAGRQIDAVARELPPDVVSEARARGRARDLDQTVQALLAELGAKSGY
jgi:predicted ATPase/DNA-binding SARP family transcriptional activator/tetratricopeptide (TPR) repeat protein